MRQESERAWYREPYVWMLIMIPASAVVMGIILIRLAIISDDGLVYDDYYKRGKEINRVLTRDTNAAELKLAAVSDFDHINGKVIVSIKKNVHKVRTDILRLRLLHATRAGFDQDLTMQRLPDGRYYSLFNPMAPGRWHLQLESQNWRLIGETKLPNGKRVSLVPNPT